MNDMYVGILFLVGIVGMQLAFRYLKQARMRKWWVRAEEACRVGDFPEAEVALQKCVSLMPLWVPPRSLLGVVLAKQNKLDGAEEQLKMVAELQPKEAQGFVELAAFYALFRPEQKSDGLGALEKALAIDPTLREKLAKDERVSALLNDVVVTNAAP
jgi:predicted Zn-dependent protease